MNVFFFLRAHQFGNSLLWINFHVCIKFFVSRINEKVCIAEVAFIQSPLSPHSRYGQWLYYSFYFLSGFTVLELSRYFAFFVHANAFSSNDEHSKQICLTFYRNAVKFYDVIESFIDFRKLSSDVSNICLQIRSEIHGQHLPFRLNRNSLK